MHVLITFRSLLTHSLGGEGYLNFEGNEFGHPEVEHSFLISDFYLFPAVA